MNIRRGPTPPPSLFQNPNHRSTAPLHRATLQPRLHGVAQRQAELVLHDRCPGGVDRGHRATWAWRSGVGGVEVVGGCAPGRGGGGSAPRRERGHDTYVQYTPMLSPETTVDIDRK